MKAGERGIPFTFQFVGLDGNFLGLFLTQTLFYWENIRQLSLFGSSASKTPEAALWKESALAGRMPIEQLSLQKLFGAAVLRLKVF